MTPHLPPPSPCLLIPLRLLHRIHHLNQIPTLNPPIPPTNAAMHPQRHRKMQRIPNRTHELQRDHRAPYPAVVPRRTLRPLILIYPRRCPRLLERRPGERVVAAYTGREEDDCAAEEDER